MRPIADDTSRFPEFAPPSDQVNQPDMSHDSWFDTAQRYSDQASRTGFVLSMLFLLAAGLYGIVLAGGFDRHVKDTSQILDQAAVEAGFRIERLLTTGVVNTPNTAIAEALQVPSTSSILMYDTGAARERLLRIGWIKAAEVRRVLPSHLDVSLVERAPFARFRDASRISVIDKEGIILGPDIDGKFTGLPLVMGDGARQASSQLIEAVSPHTAVTALIVEAELVEDRFWMLRLTNGIEVKLPRKVAPLSLSRLETLLSSRKITDMPIQTIDLRLAHRTILQLRNPTIDGRSKVISQLLTSERTSPPVLTRSKAL